jgi:hypothetical protein
LNRFRFSLSIFLLFVFSFVDAHLMSHDIKEKLEKDGVLVSCLLLLFLMFQFQLVSLCTSMREMASSMSRRITKKVGLDFLVCLLISLVISCVVFSFY